MAVEPFPFRVAAPKPDCATQGHLVLEHLDIEDVGGGEVEWCAWCGKTRYYSPEHGWSDWFEG